MKKIIPVIICVLAVIGFADSAYLTLVHYNFVEYGLLLFKSTCNYASGNCETAAKLDQFSLIGIPYSLIGAAYYALIMGVAYLRIHTKKWPVPTLLMGFFFMGLIYSIYLVHLLIFKLQIPCPFCLAAHAINFSIAILYALSLHLDIEVWRPALHW